jgi:ubiquitin
MYSTCADAYWLYQTPTTEDSKSGSESGKSGLGVGSGGRAGQSADPKSAFKGKVAGFTEGSKLKTSKNSEGNRFIVNSQL